jgi:F-type H+-transporting ATPase subunit gamma
MTLREIVDELGAAVFEAGDKRGFRPQCAHTRCPATIPSMKPITRAPIDSPGRVQAPAHGAPEPRIVVVLCAEQGFVGSFSEQILEQAARDCEWKPCEFLMVGTRGAMLAQERGLPLAWSTPMASHADEMTRLAGRMTDALYERLDATGAMRVSVVHALPGVASRLTVAEHRLLLFDYGRFHVAPRKMPPLITLAPEPLLAGLAQAYVYVELCEAAMLSFAAENEARVRAMIAARSNVKKKLEALLQRYRRVRQDETTSDILELSAGAASATKPKT